MKKENSISRRSFLKSTAMAGALGAIGTGSAASVVLTNLMCRRRRKCSCKQTSERTWNLLYSGIAR